MKKTPTEKSATVEAMFPELKGGSIYRQGRGRGNNSRLAITRAFADLLKQVSGKRIHIVKATITIIDVEKAAA